MLVSVIVRADLLVDLFSSLECELVAAGDAFFLLLWSVAVAVIIIIIILVGEVGQPRTAPQKQSYKLAQEYIEQEPIKEVDAVVARCDGGPRPEMGHPVEYIKMQDGVVAVCKYCGVRYVRKGTLDRQHSKYNGH